MVGFFLCSLELFILFIYCFSLDNSEFSRNGDFFPNRLITQQNAVHEISQTKLRANPQNQIGLISMAGKRGPKVLVPITRKVVHFEKKLFAVNVSSYSIDLVATIRITHMMHRYRTLQNSKFCVMIFVGSLLSERLIDLTKQKLTNQLATALRIDKIYIDIVVFGSMDEVDQMYDLFIPFVSMVGDDSAQVIRHYSSCQENQPLVDLCNTIFTQLHSLCGTSRIFSGTNYDDSDEFSEIIAETIRLSLMDTNNQYSTTKTMTKSTKVLEKIQNNLTFTSPLTKSSTGSVILSNPKNDNQNKLLQIKSVKQNETTKFFSMKQSTPKWTYPKERESFCEFQFQLYYYYD